MSTTIVSDKSVGPRPRWRALGIDNEGAWHNVRAYANAPDEVVVTDATGILHRRYVDSAEQWIDAIADEAGWQDRPEATPGKGLLEAVTQ